MLFEVTYTSEQESGTVKVIADSGNDALKRVIEMVKGLVRVEVKECKKGKKNV